MISAVRRNTEVSLLLLATLVALGGYWLSRLSRTPAPVATYLGYAALFVTAFAAMHVAVRKLAGSADPLFLPLAGLLTAIGFVFVSRLEGTGSPITGAAQARWLVTGAIAFIATLWIVRDVRRLARYRYTFALVGVSLLLIPSLPVIGEEINGARLWVQIGPLSFQPAELAKIALVLFLAAYLAEHREVLAVTTRRFGPLSIPDLRHFGPMLLAWGVSLLIMIQQKDLGSSLLFFGIFVAMLWIATARPIYVFSGAALFGLGAFVAFRIYSHVQVRIEIWQDPFADASGDGFQLVQSLFALATGGAWGTGPGLGRPDLIPSVQTDFIFSAVGEELGLAGAIAILTAYALFASRGFGLATRCRDDFSKLLAAGLTTILSLQTVLIIGGVTKLIPLTGVTLPFVSYGGSSLLSNFILVALLMRLSDTQAGVGTEGPPTEIGPAGGGR